MDDDSSLVKINLKITVSGTFFSIVHKIEQNFKNTEKNSKLKNRSNDSQVFFKKKTCKNS